jgi:hypothetical protein
MIKNKCLFFGDLLFFQTLSHLNNIKLIHTFSDVTKLFQYKRKLLLLLSDFNILQLYFNLERSRKYMSII